jgi:hypothetical protein
MTGFKPSPVPIKEVVEMKHGCRAFLRRVRGNKFLVAEIELLEHT